jgi:hypothetical protein
MDMRAEGRFDYVHMEVQEIAKIIDLHIQPLTCAGMETSVRNMVKYLSLYLRNRTALHPGIIDALEEPGTAG